MTGGKGPALRIAFVISSFDAGGAERVASILCNRWAKAGHDVVALVHASADKPPHYPLDPSITYVPLNLAHDSRGPIDTIFQNVRRLRRLRAALRIAQPTIIVSFMVEQNVIAILSARSLNIPIVASERSHPGSHNIGRLRTFARRLTYPLADAIVVQTADIEDWFSAQMNVRSTVLPNPIETDTFSPRPQTDVKTTDRYRIAAIGRLEPSKGFHILISAFVRIASAFPQWNLDIFGDGPAREALQRQIAAAGLETRISLRGVVDNIPHVLRDTDLFVHPSFYEGFPNTVIEALASGCCVVAANSPGAASEILEGGEFGLLVEPADIDGLATAMAGVMRDNTLRETFAHRAPSAVQRYSAEIIANRWLDLLSDIATRRHTTPEPTGPSHPGPLRNGIKP